MSQSDRDDAETPLPPIGTMAWLHADNARMMKDLGLDMEAARKIAERVRQQYSIRDIERRITRIERHLGLEPIKPE